MAAKIIGKEKRYRNYYREGIMSSVSYSGNVRTLVETVRRGGVEVTKTITEGDWIMVGVRRSDFPGVGHLSFKKKDVQRLGTDDTLRYMVNVVRGKVGLMPEDGPNRRVKSPSGCRHNAM